MPSIMPSRAPKNFRGSSSVFVYQIANLISSLVNFYEWLVIIWCLMSWFPINPDSIIGDIAQALNRIVSPYINLFRRFIPPFGGIDFSPVIAMLVLDFARRFVIQLIYSIV